MAIRLRYEITRDSMLLLLVAAVKCSNFTVDKIFDGHPRGPRAMIRRSIQVMPLAGWVARGDDDRRYAVVDP